MPRNAHVYRFRDSVALSLTGQGATNADGTRRPSLAADLAALSREGVPDPFRAAVESALATLTQPHYGDADTRADHAADAAEILARALSL